MSKTPTYYGIPKPPPWLELNRMPTVKGKPAAWDWINNVMKVPVTMNFVVVNANAKRIRRTRIGNALYFSTQDLYEFVMTRVVEQNTEDTHADRI